MRDLIAYGASKPASLFLGIAENMAHVADPCNQTKHPHRIKRSDQRKILRYKGIIHAGQAIAGPAQTAFHHCPKFCVNAEFDRSRYRKYGAGFGFHRKLCRIDRKLTCQFERSRKCDKGTAARNRCQGLPVLSLSYHLDDKRLTAPVGAVFLSSWRCHRNRAARAEPYPPRVKPQPLGPHIPHFAVKLSPQKRGLDARSGKRMDHHLIHPGILDCYGRHAGDRRDTGESRSYGALPSRSCAG
jgi:hypothetical protein